MCKKIIQNIKNLSLQKCVLFITLSVAILSVIIPIINSYQNKIDINLIEAQGHINQAETRNFQAHYFNNFANYLLTHENFETDEKLKELWSMCRTAAVINLRFRIALLYVSLKDKYPSENLKNKWASMDFENLQKELEKPEFIESDWRKKARTYISLSTWIKNLLYALAVILFAVGSLGLNLKGENT